MQMSEIPLVGIPVFLEAVCVMLLLLRFRTPRFFILWIMGMHLLTYPLFVFLYLGGHWLEIHIYPMCYYALFLKRLLMDLGLIVPEGLIIILEGSLIYLMCRYIAPRGATLPIPSLQRCWAVSLVGNICSLIASAVLAALLSGYVSGWR